VATRPTTAITMTLPESLFLKFGTDIMVLLSDADLIPKYSGKDIPEKDVSPNSFTVFFQLIKTKTKSVVN
jgi:hypothetical protein